MKKKLCVAAILAASASAAMAGGLLTNTNQNATFLRNPSRNASIAIDGVYSNPAGIAFLPQGFHLSASWQAAFQKRLMDVNNPLFGLNSDGKGASRTFEGTTKAPVIPSLQAAYVINDKWSVSAQFAVGGGGGKCEFEEGLPMFEELIGGIVMKNGGNSYALNQNLTGEQYFYGIQVGTSYKITENLSVFGGARGVIANSAYTGAITNIKANGMNAAEYTAMSNGAKAEAEKLAAQANAALAAGDMATAEQLAAASGQYIGAAIKAGTVAAMIGDYKLDCSQSGFGITPIIGVDWKFGKWNLAAK
ncbi:MAG: transporter, partial [Bacteroidaceae bacterium]|nr:transporter [Bacteroidaceae bacterium]